MILSSNFHDLRKVGLSSFHNRITSLFALTETFFDKIENILILKSIFLNLKKLGLGMTSKNYQQDEPMKSMTIFDSIKFALFKKSYLFDHFSWFKLKLK